ncbi:MAG TPA: nuclease-related domain-containing protein [Gallionella sp.]|nr:nuclease-related domain-containing protein [Gallionella sp.]
MSYRNKNKVELRSPLKEVPLRYAGQSLDEEIQRIKDDEVLDPLVMGSMAVMLSLMEWWRWFANFPPQPIPFTLLAAVVLAYTIRKIVLTKRKLQRLRLARDGEREVGQYLESLREKGYRVIHDIVANDFNIDHLLIGPKGIFTVETKTISKPVRGKTEIDYDGSQILVNGHKPERDPVVQAKAQAYWVKELIMELTGKSIPVRPTVVYPGWFVNQTSKSGRPEVWVLNHKALLPFIDNSEGMLSNEDIHACHAHLSRYVRNAER